MGLRSRIAVLGTRFGPPTIEAEELSDFDVEFVLGAAATADALVQDAGDAVAILAGSGPRFTREVLNRLPACRAIVRYGVGTETVDLQAATQAGILVANVPDYCTEEVATHTLALILACERKLLQAQRATAGGQWQIAGVRPLFSTEDQVLGIVGFGRIGQAVARKAQPFGFEILVFDPIVTAGMAAERGVTRVDLAALLSRSDVVSLNAPLIDDTYHLINAATIEHMKPTAFVVNTSRGGLIDEAALLDALNRGRLAGAALDVFEIEPVPGDHPLLHSERCLVTPHMAWYTEQASERMRRLASREVARVLRGESPHHLVNPDVVRILADRKD